MKRAVSISLGSSKRNKKVEVELLGEKISIERIGTDGDMEKAAQLYKKMDGTVDAFGVGGADLGVMMEDRWFPLHSVKSMVRFVEKTPLVDGTGLKSTLETMVAPYLEENLGDYIKEKKVFVVLGVDRWGMTRSFVDGGYECIFGDFMFGLGIPLALHSIASLKLLGALSLPLVTRLPFDWIYPTGEKQEKRVPKYHKYYNWATVIAGDCHYLKRHIPDGMDGKVIVTNTTTPEDVELFRSIGVKYLITTTPVLEGRSFGTNMMEAALVAVAGKKRKLSNAEISQLLKELKMQPNLQELN